jgi:HNH endonuclease
MKEIQLTQGKVALVDDEDYERLMAMGKWHASQNRKNGNWYAKVGLKSDTKCGRTSIGMHRVVLGSDFKVIDHEDGNGLNNQKSNLRGCTHQQNQMNKRMSKGSKTGFKGVFVHGKRYVAKCTFNKRCVHLGSFVKAEDASRAYDEFVLSRFGEFARPNAI